MNNFDIMHFCGGIIIAVLLTIIVRIILFLVINKGKVSLSKLTFTIAKIFLDFISIDYQLAEVAKLRLKKSEEPKTVTKKDKLKQYIVSANTYNLVFTLILSIPCYLSTIFHCNQFFYLMMGLLSYRLISRTMEINVAFIKDICSKSKSTDLTKYQRAALAIKSLIEEVLLFFGMYCFLLKPAAEFIPPFIGGLHSFTLDIFTNENVVNINLFGLVAVWQKVCSAILVTLCIASYLSSEEKAKDENNS